MKIKEIKYMLMSNKKLDERTKLNSELLESIDDLDFDKRLRIIEDDLSILKEMVRRTNDKTACEYVAKSLGEIIDQNKQEES